MSRWHGAWLLQAGGLPTAPGATMTVVQRSHVMDDSSLPEGFSTASFNEAPGLCTALHACVAHCAGCVPTPGQGMLLPWCRCSRACTSGARWQ